MAIEVMWKDKAACKDVGVELFFSYDDLDQREALEYCNNCDVREECLLYALDRNERYGIWGGMGERERRSILRKRRERRRAS